MGSDRTNGGDGGDRTGDAGDSQLKKVINGASQSSFNEVFEAWGKPPSRKQEVNREVQASSKTAVAEQPEPTPNQSEKKLKGRIEKIEPLTPQHDQQYDRHGKVENIKVTENNEKPEQAKNSPPYEQPAMKQVFSKPGESLLDIAKRLAPDKMSPAAIEEWAKQNLNRDGNNIPDINKVLDAGTKITLRRYENESLNTEQFGMMAVQGNPVAQAVDQMLKTPEAQDQAIRDGIKRDGSNVLVDWFKERFQDVTNVVNGFDKWVASTFSSNRVKETFGNAVDGIKRAAFGQHDGENKPIRDEHGDLQRKGVSNPQELAEYGVSTAVGAAKTMNALAHGLTPKGFTEGTHAIAEGGRQAIKNAAEYYSEHGVSDLPADTADAARSAYDQLAKWSTDRMNMKPGERGDTTGSAMAMMFFVVASSEFMSPKDAAKRMGVSEIELTGMSAEQLEAQGLKQCRVKLRDRGVPFPPEVPAEVHESLLQSPSKFIQNRIDELKAMIPSDSYNVTMSAAVVENAEGNRFILIATSEPRGYLRGGIKPKPGEVVIHGGQTHAEQDIVAFAKANNLKAVDIGAAKGIYPPCHEAVQHTDANISTPLKDQ